MIFLIGEDGERSIAFPVGQTPPATTTSTTTTLTDSLLPGLLSSPAICQIIIGNGKFLDRRAPLRSSDASPVVTRRIGVARGVRTRRLNWRAPKSRIDCGNRRGAAAGRAAGRPQSPRVTNCGSPCSCRDDWSRYDCCCCCCRRRRCALCDRLPWRPRRRFLSRESRAHLSAC